MIASNSSESVRTQAKSFRVGIVPVTIESGGGIFQYSETMLAVLAELRDGRADEFIVLGDALRPDASAMAGQSWECKELLPPTPHRRIKLFIDGLARRYLRGKNYDLARAAYARVKSPTPTLDPDLPRVRPDVHAWFEQCGIDLMVFPAPLPLAFEARTPYVMAVHDLQHRLHPEFPEVAAPDEFVRREYLFRNGIRQATVVLADSETGKEDILNLYGDVIAADRIEVLPFLPAAQSAGTTSDSDRARVRQAYGLPDRYLFYPAQFWPHKNHRRIVEALGLLRRSDSLDIDLVLVGSASGGIRRKTYSNLRRSARLSGVDQRVHHLGYVPAADMATLYSEAVALVMPTFFGPTNIPILEAWALDCPVLTSDIRGVRDQAGDAALLADPESVDALADAIRRLWLDESLRNDLIRRGQQRLTLYTRSDYSERLSAILDKAKAIVLQDRSRLLAGAGARQS